MRSRSTEPRCKRCSGASRSRAGPLARRPSSLSTSGSEVFRGLRPRSDRWIGLRFGGVDEKRDRTGHGRRAADPALRGRRPVEPSLLGGDPGERLDVRPSPRAHPLTGRPVHRQTRLLCRGRRHKTRPGALGNRTASSWLSPFFTPVMSTRLSAVSTPRSARRGMRPVGSRRYSRASRFPASPSREGQRRRGSSPRPAGCRPTPSRRGSRPAWPGTRRRRKTAPP